MPEKVLLTGGNGQLGRTILRDGLGSGFEIFAPARSELDISDAESVKEVLGAFRPELIINAAAYTAVDAAENDSNGAFSVNATGAENLAAWASENGNTFLLHISTDFVFDGEKSSPYTHKDATGPLGVYGKSKLAGEQAVLRRLPARAAVIRTSWLYSPYGSNFVRTMLRLMQERDELTVVVDQVGTPCSTATLASCVEAALRRRISGIFHWSDGGVASWYDFAVAIQEEAMQLGILDRQVTIRPIPSSAYPTAARRPAFSVLDKSRAVAELDCVQQHWREALRETLRKL